MFRGAPSFASDNLHVWADLQSWLSQGETSKSQHDIASRHLTTCLDIFAYVRVHLRQDECRNKASHVVQEMSSDSGTVLSREELMEALCVATWGGLTKSQLVSKRQEQWGENMGKLDAPIQLYHASSSTSSLLYPFVSTVSPYNKLLPERPIVLCCVVMGLPCQVCRTWHSRSQTWRPISCWAHFGRVWTLGTALTCWPGSFVQKPWFCICGQSTAEDLSWEPEGAAWMDWSMIKPSVFSVFFEKRINQGRMVRINHTKNRLESRC